MDQLVVHQRGCPCRTANKESSPGVIARHREHQFSGGPFSSDHEREDLIDGIAEAEPACACRESNIAEGLTSPVRAMPVFAAFGSVRTSAPAGTVCISISDLVRPAGSPRMTLRDRLRRFPALVSRLPRPNGGFCRDRQVAGTSSAKSH